ncbi:MAG: glycosyltransferase family 4 protein [Sedimentisphaerales bacterium]|nr:glycosyltransferase family 4 protein [Sedimentisphaerales bacterium]
MTKVHIAFEFTDDPFGGGNQFLKSLRDYFISKDVYQQDISQANAVLFNSHHQISQVAAAKHKYPEKVFIHRIDGPMKLYNNPSDRRDDIIYTVNKMLADATVFQSLWSQQKNHEMKLPQKPFEAVIHNAANEKIFNAVGRAQFSTDRKIKLVAASWSINWNKGFETYKWLDENLDFSRYQMTFVGNSPVEFKNLQHLPPMDSKGLAEKFRQSDIFIFASRMEACSNLLGEAMCCGLPVIAPNSSSNPEIVAQSGQLFDKPEDIPRLLENIINNYDYCLPAMRAPSIDRVGKAYYDFMQKVCEQTTRKKFGKAAYICLLAEILFWKIVNKI